MSTPEIDKKIRKGLPPARQNECLRTLNPIVIPAGTILRPLGDGKFGCDIGVGLITVHGKFSVDMSTVYGDTGTVLKRVVAA